MSGRFIPPSSGASIPVRFPPIARETLANGLSVWTIPHATVPSVTVALVVLRGSSDDPPDRHGLASLTGDLIDEGAGSRNALELSEAFGRLGAQLEIDVGPDATTIAVTALARALDPVLGLLSDMVGRPRLTGDDFVRLRDLRLSRLRQLSRSAGTMADRAFVAALFGEHPYGHGAVGTSRPLEAITPDDARAFWETRFGPRASTLIVGGAVNPGDVLQAAERTLGGWATAAGPPPPSGPPTLPADPRILLVDRPSAPQSELRIGHLGLPRKTEDYHALVTLNAILGGQFSSRINRRLREEKGVTYGARTSFDFRRVTGTFSCETSVQGDATAAAVADILREFHDITREDAVAGEELLRAKASLTRGYVRQFETAGQLVRAATQLVAYSLAGDTYDRFVPGVDGVTAADIHRAAGRFVRPAEATAVVVGDVSRCQSSLEAVGRPVATVRVEF